MDDSREPIVVNVKTCATDEVVTFYRGEQKSFYKEELNDLISKALECILGMKSSLQITSIKPHHLVCLAWEISNKGSTKFTDEQILEIFEGKDCDALKQGD